MEHGISTSLSDMLNLTYNCIQILVLFGAMASNNVHVLHCTMSSTLKYLQGTSCHSVILNSLHAG